MIGKIDDYLRFHESALSLRAQRQELLASNIANADTPNYKARDIDVNQGSVDGNTVDMDVERNQFADNALRYEAGITMINHQIKGLLAAIQGQ